MAQCITPIGNRSGTSDDYDSGLFSRTSHKRDERVVDDDRSRLVCDPTHDASDGLGILLPIDTGNSKANRVRTDVAIANGLFHDVMEDLFDFELTHCLKIRAGAAALRQYVASLVSEQAHRLRPTCINA
jgi:hypothetical protein